MIAFFLTPIGRWLGIATLVVAVSGSVYLKGHHDGRVACEAEVARAVEKQKAEDQVAVTTLRTQLNQLDADNDAADVEIAGYKAELAGRPKVAACTLDKADADEINR